MTRTALLLLLLSSSATAAPTVTPSKAECTAEPRPEKPIVKASVMRHSIIVDILGPGTWCQSTWAAATTDHTIELVPTLLKVPVTPCSSCSLRLQIDRLTGGRWTIVVGNVKRTVEIVR